MKRLLTFILCVSISFANAATSSQITKRDNVDILVLIDTANGTTYAMAKAIASGIKSQNANPIIKKVPTLDPSAKQFNDIALVTVDELSHYDGIAFGSPVHFGNISSNMMNFMDKTLPLWKEQRLSGKPATVFMSACSGSGHETAITSFWNILASHGMILVPMGNYGTATMNKAIAQGNTPYGTTTLTCMPGSVRPSADEERLAQWQGSQLAKVAIAMHNYNGTQTKVNPSMTSNTKIMPKLVESKLIAKNIKLPNPPAPVGNYSPYKVVGKMVYINQVALKNGKIEYPGVIAKDVSLDQAKESTKQAMLNVLAVLKQATGGDLDNVKQVVQLTGIFNAAPGFTDHALLMNEASNLAVDLFGESGKHTRATFGSATMPVNSPVEIQAIFELN